MNTRGETDSQKPPSRPNPRPWQGPAFLALGAGALAADVLLCTLDVVIDHDFSRGVYSILTGLFVVGVMGWVSIFNETQTRREAAWEVRTVLAGLAELTSRVEELSDEVDRVQAARRQAQRCEGQRYMSPAVGGHGDTVPLQRGAGLSPETIAAPRLGAARPASVDATVDPAGVSLQQAREAGIEQGFEIGYRAQLAERGVTPLPTARMPRLTRDS